MQQKKKEIFLNNIYQLQQFSEFYIKPQYRIGPYVIGLLLGYHLSNYKPSTIRSPQFHYYGWTTAIILGAFSMFGLYPLLQVNMIKAYFGQKTYHSSFLCFLNKSIKNLFIIK